MATKASAKQGIGDKPAQGAGRDERHGERTRAFPARKH